jgi:hypothetical protein
MKLNTEVQKLWSKPLCLIKQRDNFIFTGDVSGFRGKVYWCKDGRKVSIGFHKNRIIMYLVITDNLDYNWIIRLYRYGKIYDDRLCGLVVRVLGYRSGGPGSIPGTTRRKKSSGSGTGSTQPREYNWGATWEKSSGSCLENRGNTAVGIRHADHMAPSIRKSWQSLRRQAAVARSV